MTVKAGYKEVTMQKKNNTFYFWKNLPDNPQEGDIWIPKSECLYRYMSGEWVLMVSSNTVSSNYVSYDDYSALPKATSGTPLIVPMLCLGVLAFLIILMLLLTTL